MSRTGLINGLSIDERTGKVTVGRGASGWFRITLEDVAAGAIDTGTDVVVFSVMRGEKTRTVSGYVNGVYMTRCVDVPGEEVIYRVFSPSVDEDGKVEVVIELSNSDTRGLEAGTYVWNAVLVTDADYDAAGRVIADEDGCVIPFWSDGDRPGFEVQEVGIVV